MTINANKGEIRGVQSVERAVGLLDFLARQGQWCSVTDMAEALDVHKSTVVRLLATLQNHALVEQDPATSRYRLGFGVLRLAGAVTDELDLVRYAQPVCERLSAETGESVNAAILDGNEVLNIAQSLPGSSLISQNWLGRRAPLHCTSTGKVFLAFMDAQRRADILAAPLQKMTEHTIVDPATLRDELEQVRTRGYARGLEELEVGLNAVAAPVRSVQNEVVASISVAGPVYRLPHERVADVGGRTKDAALEMSRALGYAEDL